MVIHYVRTAQFPGWQQFTTILLGSGFVTAKSGGTHNTASAAGPVFACFL